MVICLERGADLLMAQLMPLPLTVSCFSKIQIGFTFLVPAHLGSPGQRAVKRMYVNRMYLHPLQRYEKCQKMSKIMWFGVMSPFNKVHMIYYFNFNRNSTLMESMSE